MSTNTNHPKAVHEGHNVKRFREIMGMKQEALAYALGEDWSQRRVSQMESREKIEEELLEQVAAILKIPVEAIRNFDEEAVIYNIQNNYEGSNPGPGTIGQYSGNESSTFRQCSFNPLDKLMETIESLQASHAENKALYERLLDSEREKVEILKAKV